MAVRGTGQNMLIGTTMMEGGRALDDVLCKHGARRVLSRGDALRTITAASVLIVGVGGQPVQAREEDEEETTEKVETFSIAFNVSKGALGIRLDLLHGLLGQLVVGAVLQVVHHSLLGVRLRVAIEDLPDPTAALAAMAGLLRHRVRLALVDVVGAQAPRPPLGLRRHGGG